MPRTRQTERKKDTRKRVPFGAHRAKLQIDDEIKGYRLRWINEIDGRIERALEGGYEFVSKDEVPRIGQGQIHEDNSDLNSRVSKVVSRGDPVIRAYLMKIKEEWYNEDQQLKEERDIAPIDEALRAGKPGGMEVPNQYVPRGHKQKIG